MKMVKLIVVGLIVVVVIGVVVVGVILIMVGGLVVYQMQLVVFGVLLLLDLVFVFDVLIVVQLISLFNSFVDFNVLFVNKGSLVEGGIGGIEVCIVDYKLKKVVEYGDLLLLFSVMNIQLVVVGLVIVDVFVLGLKFLLLVMQNVMFVN